MTTWLCVSRRLLPLMFLAVPPLVPVFYCLMDKREPNKRTHDALEGSDVPYSPLGCDDEDQPVPFTFRDKLQVLRDIKFLVASLFVGYVAKYLTLQSVVTTLAFPSAPFDPRDHYQYYLMVYLLADFIGRSYGLFMSLFKCVETTPVTKHTWIISVVIVALQMVLVLASLFRFLPNVQITLAIVFLFGLLNGALYCNSFSVASRGLSGRHIEYGRAFLTIAVSTGVVSAGLLGLLVEDELTEHCLNTLGQSEYCLTRSTSGWNASLSCQAHWVRLLI